jgi:hypothetical protein
MKLQKVYVFARGSRNLRYRFVSKLGMFRFTIDGVRVRIWKLAAHGAKAAATKARIQGMEKDAIGFAVSQAGDTAYGRAAVSKATYKRTRYYDERDEGEDSNDSATALPQLLGHPAPTLEGNFSDSATEIWLDSSETASRIDLNGVLSNDNERFRWMREGGNFAGGATLA